MVELSNLDTAQVKKAIKALYAVDAKQSRKEELIESSRSIWLVVGTKKMPEKTRFKPVRIPLKHSIINEETAEICLITKDPQREYKDLLKEKGVKVQKVIGISKLRQKFKPFEAKRELCSSFDLFLADDRILPLLPKVLGKSFFEKKKLPIPIKLQNPKQIKTEFQDIMSSTFITFGKGCCNSIKVALLSQTQQQATENVTEAINSIVAKIPGNWENIQSIHVKTGDSIALPVYNSIREE